MASIPNKGLPGRITPHPGEFLRDMLDELGVSQTTFHQRTGMSMQRISEIINGKRGVAIRRRAAFNIFHLATRRTAGLCRPWYLPSGPRRRFLLGRNGGISTWAWQWKRDAV